MTEEEMTLARVAEDVTKERDRLRALVGRMRKALSGAYELLNILRRADEVSYQMVSVERMVNQLSALLADPDGQRAAEKATEDILSQDRGAEELRLLRAVEAAEAGPEDEAEDAWRALRLFRARQKEAAKPTLGFAGRLP